MVASEILVVFAHYQTQTLTLILFCVCTSKFNEGFPFPLYFNINFLITSIHNSIIRNDCLNIMFFHLIANFYMQSDNAGSTLCRGLIINLTFLPALLPQLISSNGGISVALRPAPSSYPSPPPSPLFT